MDKMLRRGLVLVTLFVGCILTGGVEAAIREVGHSGYPYTSIQSAINAAANGDTVLVKGSNGSRMSVIIEALKARAG